MATQDAFVSDHVHQYNSTSYFVHIDPHFPQQVRVSLHSRPRACARAYSHGGNNPTL